MNEDWIKYYKRKKRKKKKMMMITGLGISSISISKILMIFTRANAIIANISGISM